MNFNQDFNEIPSLIQPTPTYCNGIVASEWLSWPTFPPLNITPVSDSKDTATSKPVSMDNQPIVKKKRGRKPLRPFDPIKKKTEEKDKY